MYEDENICLRQAVEMAERLIDLANRGDQQSKDDSCAVLYGIVRDCAYKIRSRAEEEIHRHVAFGRWDDKAEAACRLMRKEKVG